jgi:hypothetical protein
LSKALDKKGFFLYTFSNNLGWTYGLDQNEIVENKKEETMGTTQLSAFRNNSTGLYEVGALGSILFLHPKWVYKALALNTCSPPPKEVGIYDFRIVRKSRGKRGGWVVRPERYIKKPQAHLKKLYRVYDFPDGNERVLKNMEVVMGTIGGSIVIIKKDKKKGKGKEKKEK